MDERRRTPRASCRLHCRIRQGNRPVPARIVDISEGGLCLFSPVPLTARSRIELVIDVPSFQDAVVRGEVWHVRRQQIKRSKRKIWAIGVMLETSDTAYQRLLAAAGVAPDRVDAGGDAASAGRDAERTDADSGDGADSAGASAARRAGATPVEATDEAPDEDQLPPIFDRLEPQVFRVRIKARGGPRTRLLTLTAESADEARALAERDLESPWRVIEVRAA